MDWWIPCPVRRAVEPYPNSFFADPDPAAFLNSDPNPDPAAFSTRFRIQLQKLCKQLVKLHYEELSVDEKNIKNCSKVKNHKVGSNLLLKKLQLQISLHFFMFLFFIFQNECGSGFITLS